MSMNSWEFIDWCRKHLYNNFKIKHTSSRGIMIIGHSQKKLIKKKWIFFFKNQVSKRDPVSIFI